MAKPDDTRITHAPANANPSRTPSNNPIPATSNLTAILEALLASLATSNATPPPPKFARPPRIKPRRRVTVTPAANADAKLPWIRLCGNWLEPAGFAMHTRVRVHVAKGFMILIAEDES